MNQFWNQVHGGAACFLRGGEIHYFRLEPDQWPDRLALFQRAGGNCVCTYTPWLLHEPKPGAFDFEGRLDITRFAQLCAEMGLWLIARPGPYQYSELIYAGLPDWLCESEPDLRARRLDGSEHGDHVLSYNHPQFLEHVATWFGQVLPLLKPFQVSEGGPMIALQLDNETMGLHAWNGGWDFNPRAMGVGGNTGPWPEFLQQRYGTVDQAARAHGLAADAWADIPPLDRPTSGSVAERRRVKDYQDCYLQQVAGFFEQLATMVRSHGIDVPLITNAANPNMNFLFEPILGRMTEPMHVGGDHYYMLDQSWPQNHPTPQWAVKVMVSLEGLQGMGQPAMVLELPGGSASAFPPFLARDALCAYMTHLAFGMTGWDYYIFADGRNIDDSGETGSTYEYGAAVDIHGRPRRVYHAQQQFHALLDEHAWLLDARSVSDFRVGVVPEYARSEKYADDDQNLIHPNYAAWRFMHQGLLTTALCAGASPTTINLSQADLTTMTDQPLVVPTADTMAAPDQRALADFVEAGGRLLLMPVVPFLDEQFNPCTILADAIDARSGKRLNHAAPLVEAYRIHNVHASGPLIDQLKPPAGATITAWQIRNGQQNLGWTKCLEGNRFVGVLGMAWKHTQHDHCRMLTAALRQMSWQPAVESDQPNLWLRLRSNGQRHMLFAMNFHSEALPLKAAYVHQGDRRRVELPAVDVPAMSVAIADETTWRTVNEELSYIDRGGP
jgi:beta-galactosidase